MVCILPKGQDIQGRSDWHFDPLLFLDYKSKHDQETYGDLILIRRSNLNVFYLCIWFPYSWVQFIYSVMSHSLRPMDCSMWGFPVQNQPWTLSNVCPSSRCCHSTISSFVVPFSSCLQSFPASRSSPMSQFLAICGQSIRASASPSVLPINIQDKFPLQLTGLISLQSKGLSRVFSNTTVQKHQFFSTQFSL